MKRLALWLLVVSLPAFAQTRWRMVKSGSGHTCGLTEEGLAYCWGQNSGRELGDGTQVSRTIPAPVAGAPKLESIDVHDRRSCGLTQAGGVVCWGVRYADENVTDTSPRAAPVKVPFPVRALEGWFALDARGAAWWLVANQPPEPMMAGEQFSALSSAPESTVCGLTTGGQLRCANWSASTPIPVPDKPLFSSISAAGDPGCGLTRSKELFCWKQSQKGLQPAFVPGAPELERVETGAGFACGVTPAGEAWCWGENEQGQLGNGTKTASQKPVKVSGGLAFRSLSIADGVLARVCGVTKSGEAWCWGENPSGELGDGTQESRLTPVRVREPDAVRWAEGNRSVLVLPAKTEKPLPVVVLLPFTGGSAEDLWRGYAEAAESGMTDTREAQLAAVLARISKERSFALIITNGVGSGADYATGAAFTETIARYEEQVLGDLELHLKNPALDRKRVILAGFSLGGDLAWALSQKNPDRFAGALVMGSRASYRADPKVAAQAPGRRYFFALGENEDSARVAGAKSASVLLERNKIANKSVVGPYSGHVAPPLETFGAGLSFVLVP